MHIILKNFLNIPISLAVRASLGINNSLILVLYLARNQRDNAMKSYLCTFHYILGQRGNVVKSLPIVPPIECVLGAIATHPAEQAHGYLIFRRKFT